MSRLRWYVTALGVSLVALVVVGLPVTVAAQGTPLHTAAAAGDKELVARLLAEGVKVNIADKDG